MRLGGNYGGNNCDSSRDAPLQMLVISGFRQLYEDSGYKLTRIVPTESPFSVIEGVKV